jgi:trehalose 6-phosphate phosphatase
MPKPETQLPIAPLLEAVARSSQSLLLLDYDGTLAPFRVERDDAYPYPGIVHLLQQIVCNGHTRVVIVSGRDISETVSLLGILPTPEVWGLHGLQRRKPDGTTETVRLERRYLDALSEADQWLVYKPLGHLAELKTGSIAVHWRGFEASRAEGVRQRVLLGWKPIAERSGLQLLDFDGGIEIRVPRADKGDVVRLILSEMEPGTPAVYLGDDVTDERAFQALLGRGLSVLVRSFWRETAAQVWLRPPEELLDFLTQWLEAVRWGDALRGRTVAEVAG